MNKEQYKAYLRQRLNEENSDDAQIDPQIASHPHSALTGLLAQHLGVDPSEVFETTSKLTADSPQEDIDGAIRGVISLHGGRMRRKLSKEPGDPYYSPPSRYRDRSKRYRGEYLIGPDDRDEADAASNKEYNRFVGDFTKRINQDVRIGAYIKFYGKPPEA